MAHYPTCKAKESSNPTGRLFKFLIVMGLATYYLNAPQMVLHKGYKLGLVVITTL